MGPGIKTADVKNAAIRVAKIGEATGPAPTAPNPTFLSCATPWLSSANDTENS
jgi:hypothetical protein